MKQLQADLLEDLTIRTQKLLAQTEALAIKPAALLTAKPNPDAWNALQCLEHLCRYGDFYIPEITTRLDAGTKKPTAVFSSNWLGNYFAKAMLPGAKSMNTFKVMNPKDEKIRPEVIAAFIAQLHSLLALLNRCRDYDLTKTKTSISISNFIKLRLGDTLRVFIYHGQRHMQQAERAATAK